MLKVNKPPVNWNDIKLIIFDCDGVLTDGKIIYDNDSIEIKNFNAHDGMGFGLLHRAGIIPAIITGRSSKALSQRCKDVNIKHLYQGIAKKLAQAQKLIDKLHLEWQQVAYMGDDWNDIPTMQKAAFSIAPCDALPEIINLADFVTQRKAGDGAVRECIDYILYQKGIYEEVIQQYLAEITQ
jgi:3-deoxy-D-manno-octulosonate 8-phosphate phosphatase (KDO 8-P phosphatase)